MMTAVATQLSESLQALIDARLDTIDRMLVGRVPRRDRLEIVREVESQIFELLQDRGGHEMSRDDVLAVLSRLDPPEAYLPEDEESGRPTVRPMSFSRPEGSARGVDPRIAKASGVLGLFALGLILISPLIYLAACAVSEAEVLMFIILFGSLGLMLITSFLGLITGIISRAKGMWAMLGTITGALSLLISLLLTVTLILLL